MICTKGIETTIHSCKLLFHVQYSQIVTNNNSHSHFPLKDLHYQNHQLHLQLE